MSLVTLVCEKQTGSATGGCSGSGEGGQGCISADLLAEGGSDLIGASEPLSGCALNVQSIPKFETVCLFSTPFMGLNNVIRS